ncbi:MAG: hypothetical protein VW060_11000, partial [Acidimicrobiaceae bacterium]
MVGHHDTEHGIAQELEPFVRLIAGMLSAPRPVREGMNQQARLNKVITESLLEGGGRRRGEQGSAQLGDHVVDRIANGAEV